MGFWKNRQIREGEQGWQFIDDRYICAGCWDDYALQEVVRQNLTSSECSYCNRRGSQPIAAELNEVLAVIGQGLFSEWSLAVRELPWEDGEYFGQTWDTDDLFYKIGWPTQNEKLMDDILAAFGDNLWCELNPFQLRPDEALRAGWDEFKELVKSRSRFLFLMSQGSDPDLRGREEIAPANMLRALGKALKTVDLTAIFPAGTEVWRARIHRQNEALRSAHELGSPKTAKYSNRMSPAGIAMFYSALERETAVAEVSERLSDERPVGTVAKFVLHKSARVLDLAHLPPVPSLYDEMRRRQRAALIFLRGFAEDIVQPVKGDAFEHVEYVPTQIVTEFIRDYLKSPQGLYRGILYKSSRNPNGTNVCLFFDSTHCFEADETPKSEGVVLDPTSVDRFG